MGHVKERDTISSSKRYNQQHRHGQMSITSQRSLRYFLTSQLLRLHNNQINLSQTRIPYPWQYSRFDQKQTNKIEYILSQHSKLEIEKTITKETNTQTKIFF